MARQVRYFRQEPLRDFTTAVFTAHGLSPEHAAVVAETLLRANLRGVDTHGVARIPSYVERFTTKLVNPRPDVKAVARFPWAVAVDGDNGMGPVVADYAMGEAVRRADQHGVGGATARRSNHFGAASIFALMAVQHDCVGIVLSPASKSLAPFGSREPLFGTNPIAVAIPAGGHAPWVMDMATSIAARGHIRLAARRNEPIPEGWALDSEGRPTVNPEAALAGVMLPFAGAKGSALAMMIDILGGVLSGSAFGGEIRDMTRDFDEPQDVGHFFLAFKVESFMPIAEFGARMEAEIARLKALQPAAGFSEVLYPGEPEARKEAERREGGIPLTEEVVKALQSTAEELKLPLPESSGEPFSKH